MFPGLRTDAEQLATVSRMAQNLTTDVGERVGAIEGEMGEVRRRVEGTAENVARTDDALNETEVACKFASHSLEVGLFSQDS